MDEEKENTAGKTRRQNEEGRIRRNLVFCTSPIPKCTKQNKRGKNIKSKLKEKKDKS